jgi:methionyl-tRNA formyltransferase
MSQALKIIYAGTPEFAAVALQALIDSPHEVCAVYTQPDRPAGRGRKLTASPVKQLAGQHAIAVLQPESLKSAEVQAQLAAFGADVMVVAAYGLLLPPEVLAIPPLGCLNIHASLLPRWRGAAPIQRAIQAGDRETGITIMQMDAGLDTGPMLYRVATPIAPTDTAGILHDRLAAMGAEALLHALDGLLQGTLHGERQDDSQACRAPKLSKAEAEIDWQQPATRIARQVAAFNPWPVAQTRLGGQVLRIWLADVPEGGGSGRPGQVIATGKDGIEVACGEGVLRLLRLQLPGGKPLDAGEFLNAHPLDGVVLGG